MEMVLDFIHRTGKEHLIPLMREVKLLKSLKLYQLTGRKFRRQYFKRMKTEFQATELPADSRILSSSERREYMVILRSGYVSYSIFLLLRSMYGKLRRGVAQLGLLGTWDEQ
jgi:hypothetical protein